MGLFDLTQNVLDRALSGSSLRQSLLADDIANANTPGFTRSDVDFHAALSQAVDGGIAPADVAFAPVTDSATSLRADGNNVDIDTEMANLSENSVEYQALVAVARTRLGMLQTVIGGGK